MSNRLRVLFSRLGFVALPVLALLSLRAFAAPLPHVTLFPLPSEVRSTHYRVTLNGRAADVLHAASNYYLVNFDTDGPVTVTVTAEDPHFWDGGVEIQPMRHGIRPARKGATITFLMEGPEKLTITRPGDHFADADMLFLFANPHESMPSTAGIRYFGPGVHRENIDAHDGDRIYLDGGAVILGAVNIWQVKNVRIFGRGTVIYDGPQDPGSDEGWMHKPNWHCIVMDQAENIEVDGITCITRSRSWQVQMRDSRHIGLYNLKVIGGNPNDANQDGLDWLGGGDTTVRNSFFRASDDVFAVQGNWDGYDPELLKRPGHDVTNITIEGTIASTSVSNIVRVGWPQKTFNSAHFLMRDVDVLHTGFGACKVPFAFFELWADPDGHGRHHDYRFENIRLEDWYSLLQIRQPAPQIQEVSFQDVWALDGAAMVPSVLRGDVTKIALEGAVVQGVTPEMVRTQLGAEQPQLTPATTQANFRYSTGLLRPKQDIRFVAESVDRNDRVDWFFGDGSRARGMSVVHRFPDAMGTLLDGSGRFRVLLHVRSARGGEAWGSQSLVLGQTEPRRTDARANAPAPLLAEGSRRQDLAFEVPADGGYTFTLLTSAKGSLAIDAQQASPTPKARPQVCGSSGDAVQPVRQSAVLRKGTHHLYVLRDLSPDNAQETPGADQSPVVLWEGPGLSRRVLSSSSSKP